MICIRVCIAYQHSYTNPIKVFTRVCTFSRSTGYITECSWYTCQSRYMIHNLSRKVSQQCQQRRRQAYCAQAYSPVVGLHSYHRISLWFVNSLVSGTLHTHILPLGLHLAATYSLRSAPPEMLEWSPLLRLISDTFLQQAEGDVEGAGNIIRDRGNATMFVALTEIERQSQSFPKTKSRS